MRYHLIAARTAPRTAVVLGAGLAGLLAGRVLLDYCHEVIVLDSGSTAQADFPLPVQVYRTLEQLFPGITAEFSGAGAPTVDWGADCLTLLAGGTAPRFRSGLVTRPLPADTLLSIVRQRLQDYGRDALRFVVDSPLGLVRDGGRVSAVRGQDGTCYPAQVVVDTRREPLGLTGFSTEKAPAGWGWATAAATLSQATGWLALHLLPTVRQPGLLLYAQGDSTWQVIVYGAGAPASIEFPALRTVKTALQPTLEQMTLTAPEIYYQRQPRPGLLEGLLLLGEAAVDTGPFHRPALAARSVLALAETLAEGDWHTLGQRYFARLCPALTAHWWYALTEAGAWTGQPPTTRRAALLRAYWRRMQMAAHQPQLYRALVEVQQHVTTPTHLLRPAVLTRTLWPRRVDTPLPDMLAAQVADKR